MWLQKNSRRKGINDMYLILGALIVGLPIMIIGFVAAWREYQCEKQSEMENMQAQEINKRKKQQVQSCLSIH